MKPEVSGMVWFCRMSPVMGSYFITRPVPATLLVPIYVRVATSWSALETAPGTASAIRLYVMNLGGRGMFGWSQYTCPVRMSQHSQTSCGIPLKGIVRVW